MSEEAERVHGKPDQTEGSRALVPVSAEQGLRRERSGRPLATFVAQVIACDARVPDFRQHRRAQPSAATALYGAAQAGLGPRKLKLAL
jgi:hypothetical protein